MSYSGALGGAERLLVEFAEALPGPQMLACPDGPLADAARSHGMQVLALPRRSLLLRGGLRERIRAAVALGRHGLELRRLVRDLAPDLVILWGMRSAIGSLLGARLSRPLVFQHNDLLPGPLVGRLVRVAAARARLTIALSESIAADLDPQRRLGRRLTIVRPGVDVSRFDGLPASVDPPEVLVLGALVRWKRPELALEVAALARRRHPNLRLRLAGAPLPEDGDRVTAPLRARASAPDLAGAVEFVGHVEDPRGELARARCLLHCADREPFGLAVLEALAAGRPAVVADACGPAEIVDDSCGIRYGPGDAAAAAAALDALLSDPARAAALGDGGRARAGVEFDRRRALERYAAAVRPLLGGA